MTDRNDELLLALGWTQSFLQMLIRIENPWLLRIAWRRWDVPSYVVASRKLWLHWIFGYWNTRSKEADNG